MRAILLVGFMGTGKSVVSQALAKLFKTQAQDTDDLIADQAGKTISDIFEQDGEERFRQWETEVLTQLTQTGTAGMVIATGGGIVLKDENWTLMKKIGWVIGLTAAPEVILERVGTGRGRPLLTGSKEDVRQRIDHLLQARAQAYAKADWTCATDQLSPEAVAAAIKQWCAHQTSKA